MSLHRCWVPPGQSVSIAGHDLPGGLFYCGRQLPSDTGTSEPALIDPDLPVAAPGAGDPVGVPVAIRWSQVATIGSRLSYDLLPPAVRWAYLAWLAGGRRDRAVPMGFVWLFFFGLERRVLVDAEYDPDVRGDLPAIAAEVRRLCGTHGGDARFAGAASDLLDLMELLVAARVRPGGAVAFAVPPEPGGDRARVPMALRIALARCAVARTPVPAEWAASWLWYHPDLPPLASQQRCKHEFWRLFTLRYTHAHGAGRVPQTSGRPIRVGYEPVNPSITATVVDRPDLPDILTGPAESRALGALRDEVAGLLDPYSRWLAKHPDARNTLAATVLLPPELVDRDTGPLCHLRDWATASLDGRPRAVVDAADFRVFWSCADPARMSRDEAVGLATVLALAGLGAEPDVRFCGPGLAAGPAVLFRLGDGATGIQEPRRGYVALAVAADLAAGLIAAGGIDDPEDPAVSRMIDDTVAEIGIVTVTDLATESELARLAARLLWQLTGGGSARQLARRAAALPAVERAAVGRFLITVATGVVGVTPPVVTALATAYRMLGLDPGLIYPRLHAVGTETVVGAGATARPGTVASGGRPVSRDPVTVRPAGEGGAGHLLPWAISAAPPARPTPSRLTAAGPAAQASAVSQPGELRLDRAIIEQRMTETEDVSSLLAEIFVEEGRADGEPVPAGGSSADTPDLDLVAGLDRAHSDLLRELAGRPSWTRDEFVRLAARHGVMPDGALDLMNDAAMETTGEPVIEEDDDLTVNEYAIQELLA